ncbi:carboxylesterase/lipase family protein [Kordiimonas pumila]|uniref:Carboxylic ester hydrolase n=1 Tax=Kordiimonas pumila TaxID=2161677 RepID=A0ABV7D4R2_9PROT|nr:carboxylesterase/lipase family protein [Kordiimonas pumila]
MKITSLSSTRAQLYAALIACILGLTLSNTAVKADTSYVQAKTAQGIVKGEHLKSGINAFRGIRYAAPPVGALRFKAPEAPEAWAGTYNALEFPPACPQTLTEDDTEIKYDPISEDCLGLNIWTPGVDHKKRPVMVWIHGGGFVVGATSSNWYNGQHLANRGDVVVVSINYRMGAWGFLALGLLGDERYAESANVALLDQIASLKWVKDNIENFGGDPNNVTIFGESAGAASVGDLLAMPQSADLFHKAILQSGGPLRDAGRTERAIKLTKRFMELAGAKTADDLQALSMEDLLHVQEKLFSEGGDLGVFGHIVDGVVLKEAPHRTIAAGKGHRVPVLIGTTFEEMRYFATAEDLGITRKPKELLLKQMTDIAGDKAQYIIDAYRAEYPEWGDTVIQIASDVALRLPAIDLAADMYKMQPVYMYLFTYRSNSTHKSYGGSHAMEIPFVFGVINEPNVQVFTGDDPRRAEIANNTMDIWASFARNGDPDTPATPDWATYDTEQRQTMEIGPEIRLVSDPMSAQRRAWGETRASVEQSWSLMGND